MLKRKLLIQKRRNCKEEYSLERVLRCQTET